MFSITLDNQPVIYKAFTFPGGEEQVVLSKAGIPNREIAEIVVEGNIDSSTKLIQLVLLVDAIRRLPVVTVRTGLKLVLPYLPYARQDRVCAPGEAFSLGVVGDIINSLKAYRVVVSDPHSNVSQAVIKNIDVISQERIAFERMATWIVTNNAVLVCPDAGAEKKTEALAKMLSGNEVIYAKKNRNMATGEITNTSIVSGTELIKGRTLLIVDDICDGGRTFTELAAVLRHREPKQIGLFVTHGIFSAGLTKLSVDIDQIFSHNVWWKNISDSDTPTVEFTNSKTGRVL